MIVRAKKLFLLFSVLFLCVNSNAQVKIADDLFDNFEFHQAIKFYEKEAKLNDERLTKYAFCQFQAHNYKQAEELYKKVVKLENTDPINFYYYGVCLKNNKKYEMAADYFTISKAFDSLNPYNQLMLEHIAEVPSIHEKKSGLEVMNERSINSSIAEFSPKWYKEGILYIKEIKQEDKKRLNIDYSSEYNQLDSLAYGTAERPLSVMYYASFKDGVFGEPTLIAKSKKFHIGAFDINQQTGEIYFTKVDIITNWSTGAKSHPRIYKATFDTATTELVDVKKVSIKKLSDNIGAGHPALSNDGKTLYFSSNLEDGFGGSDLYSSVLGEDGKWQEPINLGGYINTPGDEVFPVVNDTVLYYSTNGKAGFGCLDIFKANISPKGIGNPIILASPQNSPADDFGILLNPNDEKYGFVSSNRYPGHGDDDLFQFRPEPSKTYVKGLVTDNNGNAAGNVLVKLYENGIEVSQIYTDENGLYRLDLDGDKKYELIATTKGFSAQEDIYSDENWISEEDFNLTLTPNETVQGVVLTEEGGVASNAKVELFDENGNMIFSSLTDENGRYQFLLDKNKEYEIVASNDGYGGSEKIITNEDWDTNKDTNITLKAIEIVKGTVRLEDGSSVSEILVKLLDGNGIELERTNSDEKGKYKFLLKPDETYTLVASDIGLGAVETIATDSTWNGKKDVDLILKPAVTAQGIVTKPNGSVASKIRMELLHEEDSILIVSKTDDLGFYQFVLDTNMRFKIVGIDGETRGSEIIETNYNYDTTDSTDIQLKAPVTFVEGAIRNEDGTSASNVIVKIFDENGNLVAEVTTDENGNYKFELEKNANYQIIAETEGFSGLENIFTGDNWNNSNRLDITLKPTGNGNYAYVTESESNKPLEKVKITLINLNSEKKIVIYSDKNGRFDFNLSPNSEYTLKFEKDNYFPKSIDIPTGKIVPNTTKLDLKIDLIMDYAGFIVKPIYFDYAKSKITDDSKQDLEQVLTTLKENPKATILIKSFADCRGGSSYNIALSAKRSSAVKQYLISKGIAEKRVTTKSLGATNFANNCYKPELCTEKEHAANRRSEFEVDFHRE